MPDRRKRITLHKDWRGHPQYKEVSKILSSLPPEELTRLLYANEPDAEYYERRQLLEAECIAAGIPIDTVNYYWYKSEMFSINAKNPRPTKEDMLQEFSEIIESKSPYRFKTPKSVKGNMRIKEGPLSEPHLFFLPLTDIHIDKFHDPAQNQYERLFDGIHGILQKISGYNIDQIVIWISSDFLNSEGSSRRTTAGTEQVNSMPWYKAYPYAIKFYTQLIDLLMIKAPVHCIYIRDNHSEATGFYLADALSRWYRKTKHVTFDLGVEYRKAYKYHDVLLGSAHGHGPKKQKFCQLLAAEYYELWGKTKFRYMNIGHEHRHYSEDYPGCRLRVLSSPSEPDNWHDMKGFTGNMVSIQGLLYSSADGTEAVIPHNF